VLLRSLLFMPGDQPKILKKSEEVNADAVIFDLEDAVSLANKDKARELVAEKVSNLSETAESSHKEYFVRVNSLATGELKKDIQVVADKALTGIMVPKIETLSEVQKINEVLTKIKAEKELTEEIGLILLFESAQGIWQAPSILAKAEGVLAAALGGEDLSLDLNATRTKKGQELFYSRSRLVMAASAQKIPALDTVFADFKDNEGLAQDAKLANQLGFAGKLAIHPGQLKTINKAFTPPEEELEFARKVVAAYQQSEEKDRAVFEVQGNMVDAPVVARAKKLLEDYENINK